MPSISPSHAKSTNRSCNYRASLTPLLKKVSYRPLSADEATERADDAMAKRPTRKTTSVTRADDVTGTSAFRRTGGNDSRTIFDERKADVTEVAALAQKWGPWTLVAPHAEKERMQFEEDSTWFRSKVR